MEVLKQRAELKYIMKKCLILIDDGLRFAL